MHQGITPSLSNIKKNIFTELIDSSNKKAKIELLFHKLYIFSTQKLF